MRQTTLPGLGRTGRRPVTILPVLLLVLLVSACGGAAVQVAPAQGEAQAPMPAASAAAAGGVDRSAVESVAGSGDTGGGDTAGTTTSPGAPTARADDLLIVYTGSLDLVVDDVDAAVAKAKAAVLATGGYVGASQASNDGEHPTAVITYRVPATRWEDALASLRGLATKVVGEQTQASEVGGQMVDLVARIRNLKASEEVLLGIAKGTGKVSDLLDVEARISDVRGQIEQLEGERARLADQAAYGTLVTTFGVEVAQVVEAKAGWNPQQDVDGALATLLSAGQALVSAGIWFTIVWLPVLLVLGVLGFAGWRIAARIRRRSAPPAGPVAPGGPAGQVPGWGDGA